MSDSAKSLLTAATWIFLAVGLIVGIWLPVTAGGEDCGQPFIPSEPLLATEADEAACADARSARMPAAVAPLVVGVGLGTWRINVLRADKHAEKRK